MSVPFQVLILGCGSAIPNKNKNHTGQLVSYNNKQLLFDCGEGTQIRLKKYGGSVQKIDHIFISHVHGDHYLGLAGLVSSMTLLGREKKLTIYGPEDIRKVIDLHFSIANSRPSFDIYYVYTQNKEKALLYKEGDVEVHSFPVKHKIPTTGFLVVAGSEKRKLLKDKLDEHDVPKHLRVGISLGKDYIMPSGKVIPNSRLTDEPMPLRSYAYCADTAYLETLHDYFPKVNLMYHEASFLKEDKKRAKEHLHSTAEQAAMVARDAGAKKLLIGHFSNKYKDSKPFIKEAGAIFPETYEAVEGETYEIV